MGLIDNGLPVPSFDEQLGVVYAAGSVDFRLWAPGAESVSVVIFQNACDILPVFEFTLSYNADTGVWSTVYKSNPAVGLTDIDGFFYEYKVVRNGIEKTVLDPYAVSLACFTGENTCRRAAIIDIKSDKAKADGGWFPDAREQLLRKDDAVIYEVSVRDFTISPDSKIHVQKGTFDAFVERLPYIASLGVNCIQLMPVLAFANHDERTKAYQVTGSGSCRYNWGYDPRSYFAPDGWFASNPNDPYSRVHDLRNLVAAAHSMGIKVIFDVVYNHVSDPSYFDDIVPGYFFRHDKKGCLTNASGCGNDIATERYMARKLIVDSARYLMRSFRIDGFRFDLMGLIDTGTIQETYEACAVILPDVLFIGEGWLMYNGEKGTVGMDQNFMSASLTASVFNDGFRDIAKGGGFNELLGGYLTGKMTSPQRLFKQLTGHAEKYQTLVPDSNVQYLACHDGLTLHDSLCVNMQISPDDSTRTAELFRRQAIGNFMVLTSLGIAFLQGGQEYGRTKRVPSGAVIDSAVCTGDFVRNSYAAGDDVNKIEWALDDDQQHLADYTAALIKLRRRLPIFHCSDFAEIDRLYALLPESDAYSLGYRITDADGGTWFILYNMSSELRTFQCCGYDACGGAVIFADVDSVYETVTVSSASAAVTGSAVSLQPLSCALIGSATQFERLYDSSAADFMF